MRKPYDATNTRRFDHGVDLFMGLLQRGSTEQMSKYVLFLHSETSHSLPLSPIGTIFALN